MFSRQVSPMHYAIIAAGEGSRLKEEGVEVPKPLVRIQGLPMIERLIRIFMSNGARSISIICNEQMLQIKEYLESLKEGNLLCGVDDNGTPYVCQLNIVVKTTASSMHSLAELSNVIPEGKFCLTTVDTVFSEKEFSAYIRAFASMDDRQVDGLFAVTPFVDDEKPLWVAVLPKENFSCACAKNGPDCTEIIGFYDRREEMPSKVDETVSGGIYCLNTRTAFPVLFKCLAQGQSRMRNFQRALISAGLRLGAYVFPKIMDIDHVSDIEKAESWLRSVNGQKLLAISRSQIYSPNNEVKDAAIFHAVMSNLQHRGWTIEEVTETEWQKRDPIAISDNFDLVVHMARKTESLALLEELRIPVLNLPDSVMTVSKSRSETLSKLQQSGVNVPRFCNFGLLQQDAIATGISNLEFPVWIKVMREDGAKSSDVSFLQDAQTVYRYIAKLNQEQILDSLLMEHVEGELVKCYVVLGGAPEPLKLLRWFRPLTSGYSKFGEAEQHNIVLDSLIVDETKLSSLAIKIGYSLGLQIFGFDMVVKPDHSYSVIDVNDWPSFSMCRDEAADAIAALISRRS